MFKALFAFLLGSTLFAAQIQDLQEAFPCDSIWQGECSDQDVMICLHGFGMDKSIGICVKDAVDHHLVAFNFPDFGEEIDICHPEKLCFGTIRELKPVIDRLHTAVFDLHVQRVHLYGFSAGGGAVINVLSVLKTHRFQKELGLCASEMDAIFAAIERGSIILDCPLKSIDEILEEREPENPFLARCAAIYKENDLRPIDSLLTLDGSKLNVLLVFMKPDDVISNRDDQLFIERLEWANRKGKTVVIEGSEGVHVPAMPSLVKGYKQLQEM